MGKRSTAKEVATMAGVSKWTVIRAFTPGASITNDSRDKVLSAARELNYSPNLLARSLATNLTHQVAVFVDDFTNPHKLPFLEDLTDIMQSEGLAMILVNINKQLDHFNALLNADQRQVDAVVLFGTSFRDETLRSIKFGSGFPDLYVLARDSGLPEVIAVNCDTKQAIGEICAHLDGRGYRRPAFLSGPKVLSTSLGRYDAFKDWWKQNRNTNILETDAGNYSYSAGQAMTRDLLSSVSAAKRPDVLMCENDILACGAIDCIRYEFGLRVPEDIAVVGFDNIEMASYAAYDLTTFEQPRVEMVRAVTDMILKKRERKSVDLSGKLVIRGSA